MGAAKYAWKQIGYTRKGRPTGELCGDHYCEMPDGVILHASRYTTFHGNDVWLREIEWSSRDYDIDGHRDREYALAELAKQGAQLWYETRSLEALCRELPESAVQPIAPKKMVRATKPGLVAREMKPGFVYAIADPCRPGQLKIGRATSMKARLTQFKTILPSLEVVALFGCRNPVWLERAVHKALGHAWLEGEWFSVSVREVEDAILFWDFDESLALRREG